MLRKSVHTGQVMDVSTSPIRRKSLHRSITISTDKSLPRNDDEAERQERRRQNDIQQRESLGGLSEQRRSLGGITDFSAAELVAHYANCIKLSTENKINPKNAFSLQLIDYMSVMLKKRDSSMNNFQVASCTLDASTKIYASRVDRVHMDVLKMASGLGIQTGNRKKRFESEEGEEGDDDNDGGGTKKRKKLKKSKRLLIKNPESLDAEIGQDYHLDPMYVYMQGNFGDCQPGFVNFMPRINVRDDCYQMDIFPSNVYWKKQEQRIERVSMIVPSLPDKSEVVTKMTLRDIFMGTDCSSNIPSQPLPLEPDQDMDLDLETEPDNYEALCMEDGSTDIENVAPPAACRAKEPAANIFDVRQHLSTKPLEYSYFNMDKLSLWAGPSHWKIIHKSSNKSVAADKKSIGVRKKKVLELKYDKLDMGKSYLLGRSIKLLKRTMEQKWTRDKVTNPLDLHYDAANLTRLFLRKCMKNLTYCTNEDVTPVDDDEVAEYDYDNLNDSQDYCPNFVECDDNPSENNPGEIIPAQDVHSLDHPINSGWKLLTPPPKVARIYIPYALMAKKVDMKKLKSTMWDILTDKENNKENESEWDSQSSNSSILKLDVTSKMVDTVRFSCMYQELRKRLPHRMAQDLSVSLAVSALLHLANEMKLFIAGQTDHTDLTITQPVE